MSKVTLFWFRRDLRLDDNAGLYHALKERSAVLPLFIFDSEILENLDDPADARVTFIYEQIQDMKQQLNAKKSDLIVRHGKPLEVLKTLSDEMAVEAIYANHDYEPAARKRDEKVAAWAAKAGIEFLTFKDQCLFEKDEILTDARKPYTVYTPYRNKVLANLSEFYLKSYPNDLYESSYAKVKKAEPLLTLKSLGFERSNIEFPPMDLSTKMLKTYHATRDFPADEKGTSHLGLHLRFGTLSVRELAREAKKYSPVWLSELIWRDFFMQILWHFPQVENQSFRPEYDKIAWRKSKADFQKWCEGRTGYPLVDAGMRELNATGYMHNRVRMVVASFLCKHLLIHWYEGERYFAKKLLDYDLSANNGNWQWAAGSGCDAAPYFRIFNPQTQFEKFDPDGKYVQKWVPEYGTDEYPQPMVDHNEARGRCLQAFTKVLKK
ncbi:deoxyribodipyrimidine photo-lyase [Bdellovibrio bacteriovorus]|uniref:Deoxyribodipyrimidine photolyase-class I n=1 Tax=Bdellovibrio bacteriovorus (strain ATCC 15356 / DSM 50701 / NCIMB 9529 / HD100) TaxID=264462 RepID=Q6ML17_BDEBA|nr:deoxyribodipyrimidine photo-lyase [Bdellovibrio bacteriovorus]CAE80040.1 deoxyribodipyrimidine photolyase-class I [Bdellovibrio bacteriovorus HD100]